MTTERERLKSEIERNRAERRKLLLEAMEKRQNLRRRWYHGQYVLQTILAGIVAAGLLAAWIVTYFAPIINKDTELKHLENQILTVKNKELQEKLDNRTFDLQTDVISVLAKLEDASRFHYPRARKTDELPQEAIDLFLEAAQA